ncbi:MAG: SMP-30/gluconolactonase/LRE family protein [Prolixibacteraceae bacterium]
MKKAIQLLAAITLFTTSCLTQKKDAVELILDTKSELGEGAVWNHKTNELLWVNIDREILNFYNPDLRNNKEMLTGQKIGTVVPAESGQVLVALENGFYSLDPKTGTKKFIADPEKDINGNRFNDGKCDPAGRFWAGTMSKNGEKGAGALYRLDPDSSVHKMIDNVSVSNGIIWSGDKRFMYYIDTPTRKVMRYDYDNKTGDIGNSKIVVEVAEEMGAPDGMTIDSDGNLWIALWGGSAVGCWNPESGELLQKIDVPAKNVTSCAFGDKDLKSLYITTARVGTDKEELDRFPEAGGLFKTRPGVKGVEASFFKD